MLGQILKTKEVKKNTIIEVLEMSVAKRMLFRTKPSYVHLLKPSYKKLGGKKAIFVICHDM